MRTDRCPHCGRSGRVSDTDVVEGLIGDPFGSLYEPALERNLIELALDYEEGWNLTKKGQMARTTGLGAGARRGKPIKTRLT